MTVGVAVPVGNGVHVGASVVKNGSIVAVAVNAKVGVVLGGPEVLLTVTLGVVVAVTVEVALEVIVAVNVDEG